MKKVMLALAATMLTGAAYAQTASTTSPDMNGGSARIAPPAVTTNGKPSSATTAPLATGANRMANATQAPGEPAAGANSFTQGEAQSRLQSNGFGKIADLKKDESGVWRARAEKGGKQVNVWLDYKGNIGTD